MNDEQQDEASFWSTVKEITTSLLSHESFHRVQATSHENVVSLTLPRDWCRTDGGEARPKEFKHSATFGVSLGNYGARITLEVYENKDKIEHWFVNEYRVTVGRNVGVCTACINSKSKQTGGLVIVLTPNKLIEVDYSVTGVAPSSITLLLLQQIWAIISSVGVEPEDGGPATCCNLGLGELALKTALSREKEVTAGLQTKINDLTRATVTLLADKTSGATQLLEENLSIIKKMASAMRDESERAIASRTSSMASSRSTIKKAVRKIRSIVKAQSNGKYVSDVLGCISEIEKLCSGYCYRYVKLALHEAGVDIGCLRGSSSACELAKSMEALSGKCPSGKISFKRLDDALSGKEPDARFQFCSYFQDIHDNPSKLRKLPPGMIVVWASTKNKPYGHTSITIGNGYEASDMVIKQMTDYSDSFDVFVPYLQ